MADRNCQQEAETLKKQLLKLQSQHDDEMRQNESVIRSLNLQVEQNKVELQSAQKTLSDMAKKQKSLASENSFLRESLTEAMLQMGTADVTISRQKDTIRHLSELSIKVDCALSLLKRKLKNKKNEALRQKKWTGLVIICSAILGCALFLISRIDHPVTKSFMICPERASYLFLFVIAITDNFVNSINFPPKFSNIIITYSFGYNLLNSFTKTIHFWQSIRYSLFGVGNETTNGLYHAIRFYSGEVDDSVPNWFYKL